MPLTDEHMIYDYDRHRYILTEQCVLDELNINLSMRLNPKGNANAQRVAQMLLKRVSDVVYSQIYKANADNDLQEWLLAKQPDARKIIKDAMLNEVEYMLVNGDLTRYAGIDIKNGKVIDPSAIRRVALDETTKDILYRPLKITGVSILYQGSYPSTQKHDYEAENY